MHAFAILQQDEVLLLVYKLYEYTMAQQLSHSSLLHHCSQAIVSGQSMTCCKFRFPEQTATHFLV